MKIIFALLLLASCASKSKTFDYMFALRDGTYICDDFIRGDSKSETYGNCEHVLYGTKVQEITIKKETHKVQLITEDAK